MTYEEPSHPINFVAHRAGLSAHVIRVWEPRDAAIQPQRTDTNRPLYSDADVDRLKQLNQVRAQGQSIRLITQLPNQEQKDMLTQVDGDKLVPSAAMDARKSGHHEQLTELSESIKVRALF